MLNNQSRGKEKWCTQCTKVETRFWLLVPDFSMEYDKPWQTANQSSLSINYVQLRHMVLNSILNLCTEVSFPSSPQVCNFMKVNSHQQRHLPSHEALLHDVRTLQYIVVTLLVTMYVKVNQITISGRSGSAFAPSSSSTTSSCPFDAAK